MLFLGLCMRRSSWYWFYVRYALVWVFQNYPPSTVVFPKWSCSKKAPFFRRGFWNTLLEHVPKLFLEQVLEHFGTPIIV